MVLIAGGFRCDELSVVGGAIDRVALFSTLIARSVIEMFRMIAGGIQRWRAIDGEERRRFLHVRSLSQENRRIEGEQKL